MERLYSLFPRLLPLSTPAAGMKIDRPGTVLLSIHNFWYIGMNDPTVKLFLASGVRLQKKRKDHGIVMTN